MSNWISCAKKLPPDLTPVLAWVDGGVEIMCWVSKESKSPVAEKVGWAIAMGAHFADGRWKCVDFDWYHDYEVVFWRSLGDPPVDAIAAIHSGDRGQ